MRVVRTRKGQEGSLSDGRLGTGVRAVLGQGPAERNAQQKRHPRQGRPALGLDQQEGNVCGPFYGAESALPAGHEGELRYRM